MNQHIPPGAWSEMQEVRKCARDLGIDPGKAMKEFARGGYSKAFANDLSERARQARMERQAGGGEAA